MLIDKGEDIESSEITDEKTYKSRRTFMRLAATAALAGTGALLVYDKIYSRPGKPGDDPVIVPKGPYDTNEKLTPYNAVTTYNNFYEFGSDKEDPSANAGSLKIQPWKISVEGLVKKPMVVNLEQLVKPFTLEDRIYRMRCVEGWSMVIPWLGFPLKDLIKRLEPTSQAKYVEFTTLYDPEQMPGQKGHVLQWPYVEGLRMDEAMHPLTILAVGLYGK